MKAKNVRTFELKLGKRALIVFVLGMSCLLFIAFLFGIKLGKTMDAYPEKISRGLPYMIMECFGWSPKKTGSETAVNETPKELAGTEDSKVDLTFYDTLAKKNVPKVEEKKTTGSSAVAVIDKPSQTSNEAAGQPPAAQAPPKGIYQVQVVSLKEKDKADQICKKLSKLGYRPRIIATELQDRGKWFRVVVDGFESREQAQKSTNIITKKISGVNCIIRKS